MTEQLSNSSTEPSLLSIQAEMREQLGTMVTGLKEVQNIHERDAKRLDTLDALQIDKISDQVSKAIDHNNKLQVALDEMVKRQDNAEKTASFSSDSEKKHSDFLVKKYEDGFERYLKHGKPIDTKVNTDMINNIINTEFKGLSDEKKQELQGHMFKSMPESKDLQVGINPDGGYWVIPQRITDEVTRVFETSPLMQLASIQQTFTDAIEMIINDNEAFLQGAVGETTAPTLQPTPTIGLLTINVNRVASGTQLITQKLIDDVNFDVSAWLINKISERLSRQLNTDMIIGDGALRARGILTYPDYTVPGVYERGAVEQIVTGSATDFTYNGLVDLQSAVKEEYQPNAVFLMRRTSFANVLKIKSVDLVPLINANQLAESPTRVILGNPVRFADDMEDVATDGLAAAYGDFRKGYKVVTRIGIRVLRDPFTEKPFIAFTADMRQGGDVTNYESFKIQRVAV